MVPMQYQHDISTNTMPAQYQYTASAAPVPMPYQCNQCNRITVPVHYQCSTSATSISIAIPGLHVHYERGGANASIPE